MPYDSRSQQYMTELGIEHPRTASARHIFGEGHNRALLDRALVEFAAKNDDYDDASDALGVVGQVSDLWRKIVKLKKSAIDLQELNGENRWQLARDIFGHALLLLHYLGDEPEQEKPEILGLTKAVEEVRAGGTTIEQLRYAVEAIYARAEERDENKSPKQKKVRPGKPSPLADRHRRFMIDRNFEQDMSGEWIYSLPGAQKYEACDMYRAAPEMWCTAPADHKHTEHYTDISGKTTFWPVDLEEDDPA